MRHLLRQHPQSGGEEDGGGEAGGGERAIHTPRTPRELAADRGSVTGRWLFQAQARAGRGRGAGKGSGKTAGKARAGAKAAARKLPAKGRAKGAEDCAWSPP